MTVCLMILDDGREDYLQRTMRDLQTYLPAAFEQIIVIDDREHRLGFAGAIQCGWNDVRTDWIFHLESDFAFQQRVPLDDMIALIERNPRLAQVALKRQAWNQEEQDAGGIVELHPDDFTERSNEHAVWTEHRRFFTTNPSVYHSRLCRMGWPQEPHSEGVFTHRLLRDPLLRFAFWGAKYAAPMVEHIGHSRAGLGY